MHQKTKNNAIISYFLVGIAWALLFNKSNEHINNNFVKQHAKSASFLHVLIIIIYLVFKTFGIAHEFVYFNLNLSDIIAMSSFTMIFMFMLLGIYKANNEDSFSIGQMFTITKTKNLVSIEKGEKMEEQDKITVILSYLPFIGNIVSIKSENPQLIQNTRLVNLFSLIVIAISIAGYYNIVQLFILVYLLMTVFASVMLFIQNQVVTLSLATFPSLETLENHLVTGFKYFLNYFSRNKEFVEYKDLFEQVGKERQKKDVVLLKELSKKNDISIQPNIIYFPIINIISLFSWKSRYIIHIKNGMIMNILVILIWTLYGFQSHVLLLIFFLISYGIANIGSLEYKFPFLFPTYSFIETSLIKTLSLFRLLKRKQKEVKEEKLEVEEQ